MIVKRITVGALESNCYVVGDKKSKDAIVIDPGDEPERIIEVINENNFKVGAIVCTHAHFDHIGVVGDIQKHTGGKILIHEKDREIYRGAKDQAALWGFNVDDVPEPDGYIREGEKIQVGKREFEVLHTPGHSPGGICLYGEGIVFTGDTLFQGSVGRTDFFGGDMEKLKNSFKRLLELPEDTKVFSGHGPDTTIKKERKENFFRDEI
jgi:glyoxylase-like metal-dependent hydrolase (beta-lactamase superfamily II)